MYVCMYVCGTEHMHIGLTGVSCFLLLAHPPLQSARECLTLHLSWKRGGLILNLSLNPKPYRACTRYPLP